MVTAVKTADLTHLPTLPGADRMNRQENGVVHHTNPDGMSVGTIQIPFGRPGDRSMASVTCQWDGNETSREYYELMDLKQSMAETAHERKADTSGIHGFMNEIETKIVQKSLYREDRVHTDGEQQPAMVVRVSPVHHYAESKFEKHFKNDKPVNNKFGASEIVRDPKGQIVSGVKMVQNVQDGIRSGFDNRVKLDASELRIHEIKRQQFENGQDALVQKDQAEFENRVALRDKLDASTAQQALEDFAVNQAQISGQAFAAAYMPVMAQKNLQKISTKLG